MTVRRRRPGASLLSGAVLSLAGMPAWALIGIEVARLTVTEDLDGFGFCVAMDGDTAIIGAPRALEDQGNTYIFFDRDATGSWLQQAEFRRGSLNFGFSVDVDGNSAIVGNFEEDLNAFHDEVQLFVRDDFGAWSHQAALRAGDDIIGNAFGFAVAIDGDTAVVGTRPEASTGFAPIPGAVYVFIRDEAGNWNQRAKLQASDGEIGDTFGKSVDVQGDTIIVGRHKNDANADVGATTVLPAVYVYKRDAAGNWIEQTKLLAGRRTSFDGEFASPREVALDGNLILMGAGNDAYGNGLAYAFEHDPVSGWNQVAELKSGNSGDNFAYSVAIAGEKLVIGAAGDDDSGASSGAAYVFVRGESGEWDERTKLVAADGSGGDLFGTAVAVAQDTVIVGAPGGSGNGFQRGAAYVFELMDSQQVRIDIKPAQDRNILDLEEEERIRVAVLSDSRIPFDPLQLDIPSISFGPGSAGVTRYHVRDLNGDGSDDLLLRFELADTGISEGVEQVTLIGRTFAGQLVSGTDSIRIAARQE